MPRKKTSAKSAGHPNASLSDADSLQQILARERPDGPLTGSKSRLCGFLTCIVSGPMIVPSGWIPMLFGDPRKHEWQSMEDVQRAYGLAMNLYNDIAGHVHEARVQTAAIDRDWCEGYLFALVLRRSLWDRAMDCDPELHALLEPIVDFASRRLVGQDQVARAVVAIRDWWRAHPDAEVMPELRVRRAMPKAAPSDPCPCGSGKAYKRCCSPLRAV